MIEHDGVDDSFSGGATAALTLAMAAANVAQEARGRALRAAAARSEVEAQQLAARYTAELAAAKAEIEATLLRTDQLDTVAGARSWQLMEDFGRADDELWGRRDELAERIHTDLGFDPRTIDEAAATSAVVTATVAAERADEMAAELEDTWDTSQARKGRADAAIGAGVDQELVKVAMVADTANATPPTAAVKQQRASAPKKARTAPNAPSRQATLQR